MKPDPEEQRLVEFRILRDEAWGLLHDDVAALRGDVEQRGLGARLADRVGEEAREVWEQTVDVASAHRGVVATTIVALVAWLLRAPIAHGVAHLFGRDETDDSNSDAGPRDSQDRENEQGDTA